MINNCMRLNNLKHITESLIVSPEHLRQAKGNKFNFIVSMLASKFLELTTGNNTDYENIVNNAKTTDEYNTFASNQENIIMPFLDIDGDKINGHEGRHRAGSLIRDNKKATMHVSIRYRSVDQGEEDELQDKYGPFKVKYDVDIEDIPKVIRGQFGRGFLMKSDMEYIKHLQK